MSRRSLALRLGVALLGVVALGGAAASIGRTFTTGPNVDDSTRPPPSRDPATTAIDVDFVPDVSVLVGLFLLLAAVAGIWLALNHPDDLVRWVGTSVAVISVAILIGGAWLLSPGPQMGETIDPSAQGVETNGTESTGGDQQADAPVSLPVGQTIVFLGLLFSLLTGLLVLGVRRGGTGPGPDESDSDAAADAPATSDDGRARAIGTAAAVAADRIDQQGDLDNEVYRAWATMATSLDVDDPETSTPGEFRAAAVDAGIDPGLVDDLTGLFETVRYGDADPTPARERRARETFERIAEEHGTAGEFERIAEEHGTAGEFERTAEEYGTAGEFERTAEEYGTAGNRPDEHQHGPPERHLDEDSDGAGDGG